MKLLLFLEQRFFINNNGEIYCERVINYEFLKRYLNVFEEVCICARTQKVGLNFKTKLRVNGEGISLLELPDFKGTLGIIKKFWKCQKIIKNNINKYDVVIMRAPTPISVIALNPIIKSKKYFAAEFANNPITMFNLETSSNKLAFFIQKIFVYHSKKLCYYANGVSYVTEKVLQDLYPCRAILYDETKEYFSSSYSTINLKKENYFFKNKLNDNEKFIISHVGFMDKISKGHFEVLKVAKELINMGYKIEIKFIGNGKLEKELKKFSNDLKIREIVDFKGQLDSYEEIQKELINSDLFLFPSRSEGLPRVLIEAMANSLPCISTPLDGMLELLPKEFLIDYKNIDKMAEIIEKFILDRDLLLKEGIRNYNKALEYESSKLERKRTEFYKKLRRLGEKNV